MSTSGTLPYPNAKDNLKPVWDRPKGEHLLLARKGGQVRSQVKKDAAKFRELEKRMKAKGVTDADAKWLLDRLNSRELSVADTILYLEQIKNDVHPAQRIALANAFLQATKLLHGEKIKTENVNVNVNTSIEEWERRLYDEHRPETDEDSSKQQ